MSMPREAPQALQAPPPGLAPLKPGLMVIHGNRPEELRALAVAWMRTHPLAPLENEVLLVQSGGIAQWLKMALAADAGCGVAAALQVELPARFLWQAYRAVLGADAIPEHSPLDKDALTWRLMRLLPTLLAQPAFAPLAHFLADDSDLRKRYQLAERLADLFDQYQVYRADWLADWAAGGERRRDAHGRERELDANTRWQPLLWRALVAAAGTSQFTQSRAGVHQRFLARLATLAAAPAALPRRVTVFGISALPAQTLEALAALGRLVQVMLYVHNPCRHHWCDIVEDRDLLRHAYRRQQRRPVPTGSDALHQNAQPLLAAWGKEGRDYISLLDAYDEPERYRAEFERIDLFAGGRTDTLLGQLQDDILDLRPPAESRARWPALDPAHDRSLRFHVAHSAQREVEILHDQLLAAFDADATLRPREVIVMVPDIDAYAPHIEAVFGRFERSDARFIPFTVADRGLRGRAPMVVALEHLLRLPESRLAASEVLDLLDVTALAARFDIVPADLPTLRRWIEGAGVRWGLDAAQRAALGAGAGFAQNTWRFGLDRMLLGYATGSAGAFAGIEPYDEVGGLEAALAGPLARLAAALATALARLREPATPVAWGERLRTLVDDFFAPQDERDEALRGRLLTTLDDWLDRCEAAGFDAPLPLAVVREAWLTALDAGRLTQRFLAGAVNFCTLMPMRAIPFRMVCLLGMNDGDYPRRRAPLDFDLMAGDYRPGDRSRREDDRYLLLEALLAARERLHVSWVGRSIRDNAARPPSVLVAQLRDHLAATWRLAGGGDLLAALTTVHPLQPFSRRYFGTDPALFTYVHEWAAQHQSAADSGAAAALRPRDEDREIDVELLCTFLRAPVRCFFTRRLKADLDATDDAVADDEPFALDALARYQAQAELLEAGMHAAPGATVGTALQAAGDRLQRSGRLPLAGFGDTSRRTLVEPLAAQLQRYALAAARWPQACARPLPLAFDDGQTTLAGWLAGVRQDAAGERAAIELLPGAMHRGKTPKWHRLIAPFARHVIAAASGVAATTVIVAEDSSLYLAPLAPRAARTILADWLRGWREGMCAPLPVAPRTAFAFLGAQGKDRGQDQARAIYEGGPRSRDAAQATGEVQTSASLARAFPDFEALTADGHFAAWSMRLYGPLLKHAPQEVDAA